MTTSGTTDFQLNMVEAVVYRAKNLVNGKSYIGFTTGPLRKRISAHLSRARAGTGRSVLHKAIAKYGEENFVWGVIAEFEDKDLALMYERELVDAESPEYNTAPGGASLRGPVSDLERSRSYWKGRIGNRRGAKMSEASRSLMRDAKLGKPGPWTGKPRPGAAAVMKKIAERYQRVVLCIEDGRVFDSGADVARFYGLAVWEVHYSAREGRSRGGKTFRFAEKAS